MRTLCSIARHAGLVVSVMTLTVTAFAGPSLAADIRVVASIKPVHSLVSAVMEGVGKPHLLMRGRVSPHTFTIRPSDAAAIADAQVVFLIDESMETSLADAVETLADHAQVVMLAHAKGLIRRPLREGGAFEADHDHGDEHHEEGEHGKTDAHDHDHDEARREEHHDEDEEHHEKGEHAKTDMHDHDHDEARHEEHHDEDDHDFEMHVWLDPVNGGAMARMIAETLSKADPANASVYRANAQALLPKLDKITEEIRAEVASAHDKPFLVFHDAYRYFEDRFGLKAVGSIVVSPERKPGARRLSELREKVRESGVVCVFDEPQFNKRIVEVVVQGSEVRTGTIDPLGADIEDGPELYFTLLRNMANTFKTCLAPGV